MSVDVLDLIILLSIRKLVRDRDNFTNLKKLQREFIHSNNLSITIYPGRQIGAVGLASVMDERSLTGEMDIEIRKHWLCYQFHVFLKISHIPSLENKNSATYAYIPFKDTVGKGKIFTLPY